MEVPEKISFAAERLKQGHRVNRITVRDFLRHFGAERRGSAKVQAIRNILDSLEMETDPDFEIEWIDAPIWLRLKQGIAITPTAPAATNGDQGTEPEDNVLDSTPAAVEQAEEQSQSAPTSVEPESPKGVDSPNST